MEIAEFAIGAQRSFRLLKNDKIIVFIRAFYKKRVLLVWSGDK
jgi:hypothetical protein